MNKFKKWDDIDGSDFELRNRRRAAIIKVVNDFYQKIKGRNNVISAQEVYKLCDKFSFFGNSIWYNKYPFSSGRKTLPVIFALKSGIVFKKEEVYFLNGNDERDYWEIHIYDISTALKIEGKKIYNPSYSRHTKVSNEEDVELLKEFINELNKIRNKFNADILFEINKQNQLQKQLQKIEQDNLNINKKNQILNFDQDGDGKLDLIENDFNKLLNKNQKKIIELDKNYVHQFVKISNFIKTKKANTQKIFESIKDTSNQEELEERVNLLKNQIHAYELLVFHSINMIGALVSDDLISFYEIYESFDKLNIFNSNWENEVAHQLKNIEDGLSELMYSIDSMEINIVNGLNQLTYLTQEGFSDLERSVTKELQSIDSSIKFNNLLTGISTYQLYKINKQTKPLLP
jgi:hypothetical protein